MTKKELTFEDYLEEKYGTIQSESMEKVNAISTGSLSLDYCTGVGGIPVGRFTEIWGPESSGKTTLILETARNAILAGGRVLYFDAEHGLDWDYITEIVGKGEEVDKNKFVLIQTTMADVIFDLSEKALESGEFNLIVVDSIAMIVSKAERDNPFEKDTMGQAPRIISKFLRRNSDSIRNSNTAYVFINQLRDKIGAYVPTFEPPGGHAIRHACSLIISLSSTSSSQRRIMEGEEEVGVLASFVIKKNKLASPFKAYNIPLIWGYGVDRMRDVLEFASTLGVLVGSYYKFNYNGEDINLGHGMTNASKYLEEHKEVLDKVIESCYNITNQIEERKETDVTEDIQN